MTGDTEHPTTKTGTLMFRTIVRFLPVILPIAIKVIKSRRTGGATPPAGKHRS